MYVPPHAIFFRQIFQPLAIVAISDSRQLQFRPARQQSRQRRDQRVHSFVAFTRAPASHRQDHSPFRKIPRSRDFARLRSHSFELRIKRPRQHTNFLLRNSLSPPHTPLPFLAPPHPPIPPPHTPYP